MRADVAVPQGGVRSADLLPVLREISSTITHAIVDREERLGRAVSCRRGCSACCQRIYVEVSEAEAYRLKDTIQCLPDDHRQRVLARFESIRERLLEANLYGDLMQIRLSEAEARLKMGAAYYGQNIACPFLENDACSIYSERPLACREYLVTSPAEECERPEAGGVRRVPFPWQSYRCLMGMAQHASSKERLVPLALLLDWVAQNPEPAERQSGVEQLMRAFSDASFEITTPERNINAAQSYVRSPSGPSAETEETFSHGCIVPDYALPDALMVPHYGAEYIDLLEHIASAAARSVGVILLSSDPERTQAFITRQPSPERFSVVVAAANTAWIRDRAPIAVYGGASETRWHLPQMPDDGRDADAKLFKSISARRMHRASFNLAHGNLVSGPDGLALSTTAVFEENPDQGIQGLCQGARQLGINKWIVFPPFSEEPSRHADMHVRFLDEDLAAIGWNLSSPQDRSSAEALMQQMVDARPSLRVLRIPMRSEGQCYASPLNWIQLGKVLLVPRYTLTKEPDVEQIGALLEAENFRPLFIESPTLDTGGSLHCLTASIHV